jgi:endonuclease-3
MKVVPKKHLRHAHHYLILHGRYTCVAKKPLCYKCPVYEQCGFKEKKKFAASDPAAPKPKAKSRLPR